MQKIIKKYGNSAVVVFTTEDLTIMGLQVGDVFTFKKQEELIKSIDNTDAEREKYFQASLNQTYAEYRKGWKDRRDAGQTELTKKEFDARQEWRKENLIKFHKDRIGEIKNRIQVIKKEGVKKR